MATPTADSIPSPALRLLSLDGGGIRGVSELVILEEIMHRVQRAKNLPYTPLPAEYFDMICGTSTGGLIALLLGRLRLSVPQAIEKYRVLAKQVFSEKKPLGKDGTFKASNLEKAIKEVVEEELGDADEKMWTTLEGCKTFVCAVPAKVVNKQPRLFRCWSADENPGYNCKIWEAGRATSAAPRFFKRIYIGDPGIQEEFIDGGLGCNNPIRCLMQEARREFGPSREVSCIVSIGAGKPKVAGFDAPTLFQRALPSDLIRVLATVATDCEAEAVSMRTRYKNCHGLYHRLNVDRGLENVSLQEWEKLGDVKQHTMAYLAADDISDDINVIVQALSRRPSTAFSLAQLDGTVSGNDDIPGHFMYPGYNRVNHFISRRDPQDKIRKYFRAVKTNTVPTIVVLLGMGGCGKSQLALEYCQRSEDDESYIAIFWIDATSPATVEQSFAAVAKEISKPGINPTDGEQNVQYVLSTMKTWRKSWLLVFDNFDDLNSFPKGIKRYIPQNSKGSVIITSRDRSVKDLGCDIEVSTMMKDEAIKLLLRGAEGENVESDLPEAHIIVQKLGLHALAIDQARAYISARRLQLNLFLEHYNDRKEAILKDIPGLWDYQKKLRPGEENETKLSSDKTHILTLIAFFDSNEISDELFGPYASKDNAWMTSCRTNGIWDKYKLQDILKELWKVSLIQNFRIERNHGALFSLHPLVKDWIIMRRCFECRGDYTTEATLILSAFILTHFGTGDVFELGDVYKLPFYLQKATRSHIAAIIENQQKYLTQLKPNVLDCLHVFGRFLHILHRYKKSELIHQREVDGRNRLGTVDWGMLRSIHCLALTVSRQQRYDEAELILLDLIPLITNIYGRESCFTLEAMDLLATIFRSQDANNKAENLYREILAIGVKVFNRTHPATLQVRQSLADALCNQYKYEEAEHMSRETLDISTKAGGEGSLNTVKSMESLAKILQYEGKFDEAELMHQQSVALTEKVMGKEHLSVLTSKIELGIFYFKQQNYKNAEF